jgi:hypothetical protein
MCSIFTRGSEPAAAPVACGVSRGTHHPKPEVITRISPRSSVDPVGVGTSSSRLLHDLIRITRFFIARSQWRPARVLSRAGQSIYDHLAEALLSAKEATGMPQRDHVGPACTTVLRASARNSAIGGQHTTCFAHNTRSAPHVDRTVESAITGDTPSPDPPHYRYSLPTRVSGATMHQRTPYRQRRPRSLASRKDRRNRR